MRRAQHSACLCVLAALLLPAWAVAQTLALTNAQIVRLVESTPQLHVDSTVSSSAFDPKTHPYVDVRDPKDSTGGFLSSEYSHDGRLSDGTEVLAVPLDSGGSGGVFTQVVFARRADGTYAYVGAIGSGGHLDVRIEEGFIVATLPYYGPNDPNCCPSKTVVQSYTLREGKLVLLSEKRFDSGKAE